MAFATTENVEARLGRALTAAETTTVTYLLDGASAMVALAAGKEEADIDPVPAVLPIITVELVLRALSNPNGLASLTEQLGQHQYTARFRKAAEGAGLELSRAEELLVSRAVHGSNIGSAAVQASQVDEVHDLIYGS